jgi:serine/threonine-protein kinase Chk1
VVAIKVVSRKQAESCPNYNVKKEVLIHQSLNHPNIVKLIEAKKDEENYYLVLELGLGGELFEKIEPDAGFPEEIAHFYFLQLMNVLKYLQGEGVAHRDIKPENLLLDQYGNLKVTDFGLATVFKQHGQTRHLETPCGTAMYMAPEILSGDGYEGDQADMWSAAVVLFVMTAGCHPWEEPTSRCGHYDCFVKSRCHSYAPWNRFSADLKHLLTWMLKHNPKDRATIDQVLAHPWVNRPNPFMDSDGECGDPKKLAEALEENHAPDIQMDPSNLNEEMIPALTQLEISALFSQAAHFKPLNCFSQPIPMAGSGKSESSPTTSHMHHLQRLARFYTKHTFEEVMERLAIHLDSMLVQYKIAPNSNRVHAHTHFPDA